MGLKASSAALMGCTLCRAAGEELYIHCISALSWCWARLVALDALLSILQAIGQSGIIVATGIVKTKREYLTEVGDSLLWALMPCNTNEFQRAFTGTLHYVKVMNIPNKLGHHIHARSCAVDKILQCWFSFPLLQPGKWQRNHYTEFIWSYFVWVKKKKERFY